MDSKDIRSYNLLKRLKIIDLSKKVLAIKDGGFKELRRQNKEKRINRKLGIKEGEYFASNFDPKYKIGYIDIVIDDIKWFDGIYNRLNGLNINYFVIDAKESNDKFQKITRYDFNHIFVNRSFIYVTKKPVNMYSFYYGFNIKLKDISKEKIEKMLNTIEGLKLIANYNTSGNVTVKTSTFFDSDGKNYYSGGAERYLIDLYEICEELGMNLDIYQNANKPYFRKYHNINVIGLCPKNSNGKYNLDFLDKQTKNYIYETKGKTCLTIYSAFQECFPNPISPSIGISHGISWDNKTNKFKNGMEFWNNNITFIEGAKQCDKLVSVDTNTANWFQTIDFNLGNKKFNVIPNYVDSKEFCPNKDFLKKKEKIVITYPRRLYEPRGLYITLDIVDEILKKYNNVEFHFVGKGFENDTKNIDKKIKEHKGKIFCYNKSPFEMHEVYKNSDISLIPTLYSEGTSLSCLEALSSGNIVVSTRIGGLTDLVIDGYNGYLIEPNSKALLNALEKILDNFDSHKKMKERAVEVAAAFNKDLWKEKWKKVISEMNIKASSKTNDLIEIYVKNASNIKEKTLNIIKDELKKGNLIYLKSETEVKVDNISAGLLQLIEINEEIVSEAKKIYVEKEVKKKIKNGEII